MFRACNASPDSGYTPVKPGSAAWADPGSGFV
ncbi:hypothetical protein BJ958_000262 [Nocardioides kongjuensis]|uniref:Uncharacterized protein n=1 Tax=Nocardioides kongjuensis TaxID=349522 RepID=A0A852RH90_9ACTN|nr:hypothetical protein [Nocardioides kongjuensis]